jgi:DNA topoisomerase-1
VGGSDDARAAGLRYSHDGDTGISRQRAGRGFSHRDARGALVRNEQVLARIRALGIPPAWREVWICPDARGHLQVTGRDARGRKQYLYHAEWRSLRDATKFDRMLVFG